MRKYKAFKDPLPTLGTHQRSVMCWRGMCLAWFVRKSIITTLRFSEMASILSPSLKIQEYMNMQAMCSISNLHPGMPLPLTYLRRA